MRQIRSALGPIFHAGFFAHHLWVLGYGYKIQTLVEMAGLDDIDQRIADIKNFSAVFFTNWNLMIQTIYFALAVTHDVLHIFSFGANLKVAIDKWKGFLFTSFVFPCSIFVSTMFWGIYSIDRELVLPQVCDEYIPVWLNHSVHTAVLVFLIVEVLIANQLLPTFTTAFIALTALTLVYDITFFITYFIYGRFVYGLFHFFTWPERILFMLCNYFSTVIAMKIGIVIENFKYSLSRRQRRSLRRVSNKE